MKRTIIIILVLIVAAGGWYAYKLYDEKTPDIVNKKPDIVITATQLLDAFNKDTAAARKQFADKIIEISGNVKRIDTTGSVVLGDPDSASEVTVGLDRRHLKDHQKLKVGSVAILQGVFAGSTNNSSADPTDMLAALGTTVELRSAGVKDKK